MVEDALAGQPGDERAAGEEESDSALEDVGMRIAKPQDLRRDVRGIQVQPGDPADRCRVETVDGTGLGDRPAVEPDDGRVERLAIGIDGDEAVDLGGEAERRHVRRRDVRALEQATDHAAQRVAPVAHVLLGPAGVGVVDVVRGRSLGDDRARRIEQRALEALRSHVTADGVHRSARPPGKCKVVSRLTTLG